MKSIFISFLFVCINFSLLSQSNGIKNRLEFSAGLGPYKGFVNGYFSIGYKIKKNTSISFRILNASDFAILGESLEDYTSYTTLISRDIKLSKFNLKFGIGPSYAKRKYESDEVISFDWFWGTTYKIKSIDTYGLNLDTKLSYPFSQKISCGIYCLYDFNSWSDYNNYDICINIQNL